MNAHARARLLFVKSRLCRSLSRARERSGIVRPQPDFYAFATHGSAPTSAGNDDISRNDHDAARRSGCARAAPPRYPVRWGRRWAEDSRAEHRAERLARAGRGAARLVMRARRRATAGTPSCRAAPASSADKKTRSRRRKEATSVHRVLYTRPPRPVPRMIPMGYFTERPGPEELVSAAESPMIPHPTSAGRSSRSHAASARDGRRRNQCPR